VDAKDEDLDGDLVARALKHRRKEEADLVLGANKRSTATRISAQLLPSISVGRSHLRPQHQERRDKALLVGARSMAVLESAVTLPRWSASTLRIVAPKSVTSVHTPATHNYADGVRFAALMAIMAAKKKPLVELKLAELAPDTALKIK